MTDKNVSCLSIAGSDSSGGAGIQADLKTFAAHRVYGMSVITAVTVQNTTGVSAVHAIPSGIVQAQIQSVVSDIPPDAIKIGMLFNADIVDAVANELANLKQTSIVLDPVLISTSGNALMQSEAISVMINNLLPLVTLITPNAHEVAALLISLGIQNPPIEDAKQLENATFKLSGMIKQRYGVCPAILAKGGHLSGANASDLLLSNDQAIWLSHPRIDNPNTHGTGCTLSSAIAVQLAKGEPLKVATKKAKAYLSSAIRKRLNLGQGPGPLQHTKN